MPHSDRMTDGAACLDEFEASLRTRLGGLASFERESLHHYPNPGLYDVVVVVGPVNPASAPISWIASDVDVVLSVGRGVGPRWELCLDEDFGDFKSVVEAAVDGRVRETFGWHRSFVEVLHEDGQVERATGSATLLGLVPTPGWRRWGRRVRYEPYRG